MKLLLIEDDDQLSEAISHGLKSDYEIECHHHYMKGYQTIFETDFDGYLLDIQLADGNGLDLISAIRKISNRPIIMLSVLNDDATIIEGLNRGADDYIVKPFGIDILKARLKSCLRRYVDTNQVVEYTNLSIDPVKRKLYRQGKEIVLTAMESNIFFCLFNNQGRVITRRFLLEEFWDLKGNFVEDNTLSVTIRRLKSKVGKEYIGTKYNIGYYFKEDE